MQTLLTILENMPYILQGSFITLVLVIGSLAIGFLLGLPLAVMQVYGSKFTQKAVGLYVWFFRGMPILLLLFLFYFGIFNYLSIDLDVVSVCCIVLGLASSAYQSQIFRGAIQSISYGQMKAARALGMTDAKAIKSVILPQALRHSVAGWSNEFSIMLKDSALCFALGAPDIMARTNFVAARTYEYLPLYIMAGILYYLITLVGVRVLRFLERKYAIAGHGISA